jgi:zinc transporter ZupT
MFRKSPFAGIIRPEYYIAELLIWSHKAAESMLNLTKAYDWRVSQWSAFSTALITATLAFISAVVLEYFKDTVNTNVELKLRVALLGIVASILVYLMSQKRITLLKEQFLRVCTLLQRREG